MSLYNLNCFECSICKFIENTKDKTVSKPIDKVELQTSDKDEKPSSRFNLRDGMSLESAKFAIDRCAGNNHYEIRSIENKGRYFTADFTMIFCLLTSVF